MDFIPIVEFVVEAPWFLGLYYLFEFFLYFLTELTIALIKKVLCLLKVNAMNSITSHPCKARKAPISETPREEPQSIFECNGPYKT